MIGQLLSFGRVSDFDEGIIELLKSDVVAAHLDGEPFVAVDGDLDDEREPGLDADMDEAKLGMEEIIIEAEALAVSGGDSGSADAPGDFEGETGFQF